MKLKISGLVFLLTIMSNLSDVFAYFEKKNTNLSDGMILFFIPLMLAIIYLANKGEVK